MSMQQSSLSEFPELLMDDDIWKAVDLSGVFDEDSGELRPRLTSVSSPSLSSTSPPSPLSSPSWSKEELPPPRSDGSRVSSSISVHKSSVGLLLPWDPGLKGGLCFPLPHCSYTIKSWLTAMTAPSAGCKGNRSAKVKGGMWSSWGTSACGVLNYLLKQFCCNTAALSCALNELPCWDLCLILKGSRAFRTSFLNSKFTFYCGRRIFTVGGKHGVLVHSRIFCLSAYTNHTHTPVTSTLVQPSPNVLWEQNLPWRNCGTKWLNCLMFHLTGYPKIFQTFKKDLSEVTVDR